LSFQTSRTREKKEKTPRPLSKHLQVYPGIPVRSYTGMYSNKLEHKTFFSPCVEQPKNKAWKVGGELRGSRLEEEGEEESRKGHINRLNGEGRSIYEMQKQHQSQIPRDDKKKMLN